MQFSRDPAIRLRVFHNRGLIPKIPSRWQLVLGQLEMGPYVVKPDAGDGQRYANARFGHPLLRTPIVFAEIGMDHFRVGHGLHAKPESLFRHLNFVFHEGMPVFDLQLIQTLPGGLEAFRKYTADIETGRTAKARSQKRRIDWVLPGASKYRRWFLDDGGWIDRCLAFDYPGEEDVEDFLRPEFMSLVRFMNYCAENFEERLNPADYRKTPSRLFELASRAFR